MPSLELHPSLLCCFPCSSSSWIVRLKNIILTKWMRNSGVSLPTSFTSLTHLPINEHILQLIIMSIVLHASSSRGWQRGNSMKSDFQQKMHINHNGFLAERNVESLQTPSRSPGRRITKRLWSFSKHSLCSGCCECFGRDCSNDWPVSRMVPGQRWPHLSRSQDDSGNSSNIHVKGSWDRKEKLGSSWCNVICSHFLHQISENGMWAFLLSISRESFVGRGDGEIHKPERFWLQVKSLFAAESVLLSLRQLSALLLSLHAIFFISFGLMMQLESG